MNPPVAPPVPNSSIGVPLALSVWIPNLLVSLLIFKSYPKAVLLSAVVFLVKATD